jgi:RNA polymerase sigma factor (sigma-70 family)
MMDERLIEEAIAGRPSARTELVGRLDPVVRARIARVLSGRRSEIDDLAQDIWVTLFAHRGKRLRAFDPARGGSLEGFVGVLAEREARQLLRRGRAKKRGGGAEVISLDGVPEMPIAGAEPTPEAAAETKDLAARLGGFLDANLPPRGRLVLRYLYTDGNTPAETARALGAEIQVVYNWQHKIRALSRMFLET